MELIINLEQQKFIEEQCRTALFISKDSDVEILEISVVNYSYTAGVIWCLVQLKINNEERSIILRLGKNEISNIRLILLFPDGFERIVWAEQNRLRFEIL